MAKHRRFSDNPKDDSVQNNNEKLETPMNKKLHHLQETPLDLKTILLSGTKYAYTL